MSELILQTANRSLRHRLLGTVSAVAFLITAIAPDVKAALSDDARPTVWIELGGQLERARSDSVDFAPSFSEGAESSDTAVMQQAQKRPAYAIGGEGSLTLAPKNTDWVFAAKVRYGRANANRHRHHESDGLPKEYLTLFGAPIRQYTPAVKNFGDGQSENQDTHLIVDFQAGKDIGLGLFGTRIAATISAGVRFAQFASKSDVSLHNRQGLQATPKYSPGVYHFYLISHYNYTASSRAERNTHAIGPSVSWDASLPLAKSDDDLSIAFDWGANASLLFGRQRAKLSHQTQGNHVTGLNGQNIASTFSHGPYGTNRSRSVTIPNVGGFAGVSFRYLTAKMAVGYRADFFFNAMDVGNGTHRSSTLGFYGPFATISIGLDG